MCYEEVNAWTCKHGHGCWERAKFKVRDGFKAFSNVNSVTVYSLTLFQTCMNHLFCEKQKVF